MLRASDFALHLDYLMYVWTSYFGIMGQYYPTFDLKINVGLCDLYFMVQWFWSYISKTIWCMSVIFSDNETVWPKLWPQSKYKSTWPIVHGLVSLLIIFKNYLMYEHHSWYHGTVWHMDQPYQVYVGQWPIFYGSAILLHILTTIWRRNVVLWIMDQCWLKDGPCKNIWGSVTHFS